MSFVDFTNCFEVPTFKPLFMLGTDQAAASIKVIPYPLYPDSFQISTDIHGTLVHNLTYQLTPFGEQLATNAFEITTGSVAYDAPFGPTVAQLAAAVSLEISNPAPVPWITKASKMAAKRAMRSGDYRDNIPNISIKNT
jgi:hypothetical protein